MEKIKIIISQLFAHCVQGFKKIKEDKSFFVFLLFLAISTCFWFLNALRKDNYISEITIPIQFENIPSGEMLADTPMEYLELKVKGGGFSLLRYKTSDVFFPLELDVNDMRRVKHGSVFKVFVLSRGVEKMIASQLSNDIELLSIAQDTIFINLVAKVAKKVPVKLDIRTEFEKQYLLSGPVDFSPDSITISGAESIIDTVDSVLTRFFYFGGLNDTVVRTLPLAEIDGVEFDNKRLSVTIPVEPFAEAVLKVPVEANSLPDSLILKTFPAEINVSFRVGLSRYEMIQAGDFKAVVDFNVEDFYGDASNKLKVKIERQPSGIKQLDYSPIFVEYFVERKK